MSTQSESKLKPRVLHIKHDGDKFLAGCDVYVGRPTKWGNPFVIGKDGNRNEVIEKYRKWIHTQSELMKATVTLRGRNLFCWCSPLPCHADVLLELANK